MTPVVRYRVSMPDPRSHRFLVRCEVEGLTDPVLALPSWLRGSYLVRDFAKHIIGLRASRDGVEVPVARIDKRSLRVPGSGPLQIDYAVHALDESVRKAWLDTRRAFFNGSSLFYCPRGCEDLRFVIDIERPTDPLCASWRVATTLKTVSVDSAGFGSYEASGYEELIDHPVTIADFARHDFDVDGLPHALVVSGRADFDAPRVIADLARICHVERELFGQQPAAGPELAQYLFLTHVVAAGYGGLEHRNCTALICSRGDLPRIGRPELSPEYRTFLSLCSHEYFHLWNVKRITAQSFLASDLGREAYTRDLWHYEGATSYYDDLFLLRAGIIDAEAYLDLLAEQATRLQRNPARLVHTLEDASFETWIKYYQPDENAANASTNYYVKGSLAALCLDLHLRLHNGLSLDEVMRALWRRFGATGEGVPENGLEQLALEMADGDSALQGFFDRALRGTDELPLAELLAGFGVTAQLRACASPIDEGGRTGARGRSPWAGLRLRPGDVAIAVVLTESPAQQAGLMAGDQLVAIDGLRVTAQSWTRRVEALDAARPLRIDYFRGEELLSSTITLIDPPLDTWTLTLDEAEGEHLQRRRAWLGV